MKTHIVKEITKAPLRPVDDRKGIIGGSQIGVICGLKNCYSSEFESYRSYVGMEKEELSEEKKETFLCGHILEESIARHFAAKTGYELYEPDYMYIDPENPSLILHPDREFIVDGKRYALECKTASSHAFRSIKWPEVEELDRSERPSIIPAGLILFKGTTVNAGYYAQCMWYYALAGYEGVFLGRLTDNRFYYYYVPFNGEAVKFFYTRTLRWKSAVDKGYVPAAKNEEELKVKFPVSDKGSIMEADENLYKAIITFKMLSEQQSKLKKEIDSVKTEIGNVVGTKDTVLYNNEKILTWKTIHSSSFNKDRLAKDNPEIVKAYTEETKYRQFRNYIDLEELVAEDNKGNKENKESA